MVAADELDCLLASDRHLDGSSGSAPILDSVLFNGMLELRNSTSRIETCGNGRNEE